jgi:hypothetical protein
MDRFPLPFQVRGLLLQVCIGLVLFATRTADLAVGGVVAGHDVVHECPWVGVVKLLAAAEGTDPQELLHLGFVGVKQLDGSSGDDI